MNTSIYREIKRKPKGYRFHYLNISDHLKPTGVESEPDVQLFAGKMATMLSSYKLQNITANITNLNQHGEVKRKTMLLFTISVTLIKYVKFGDTNCMAYEVVKMHVHIY